MCAHPGQQLRELEGLDEVVVGACVEPRDDVELLIAGREDENRQLGTRRPEPPADLDPVDVRQAEVEDDQSHGRPSCADGGAADGEPLHGMALTLEHAHQPRGDGVVVLDEQHARRVHGRTVPLDGARWGAHGATLTWR